MFTAGAASGSCGERLACSSSLPFVRRLLRYHVIERISLVGSDGDFQDAVALVCKEVVGVLDLVERVVMGDKWS